LGGDPVVSRCTSSLVLPAPHTVPQHAAGGKSLRSERALRVTSGMSVKSRGCVWLYLDDVKPRKARKMVFTTH